MTVASETSTIESVLQEQRVFEPPAALAADAKAAAFRLSGPGGCGCQDPDQFWEAAKRELHVRTVQHGARLE